MRGEVLRLCKYLDRLIVLSTDSPDVISINTDFCLIKPDVVPNPIERMLLYQLLPHLGLVKLVWLFQFVLRALSVADYTDCLAHVRVIDFHFLLSCFPCDVQLDSNSTFALLVLVNPVAFRCCVLVATVKLTVNSAKALEAVVRLREGHDGEVQDEWQHQEESVCVAE